MVWVRFSAIYLKWVKTENLISIGLFWVCIVTIFQAAIYYGQRFIPINIDSWGIFWNGSWLLDIKQIGPKCKTASFFVSRLCIQDFPSSTSNPYPWWTYILYSTVWNALLLSKVKVHVFEKSFGTGWTFRRWEVIWWIHLQTQGLESGRTPWSHMGDSHVPDSVLGGRRSDGDSY